MHRPFPYIFMAVLVRNAQTSFLSLPCSGSAFVETWEVTNCYDPGGLLRFIIFDEKLSCLHQLLVCVFCTAKRHLIDLLLKKKKKKKGQEPF